MAEIEVLKISDQKYQVSVTTKSKTRHTVSVSDEYYQRLTKGKISIEVLLVNSFEFLLKKEPNTSILSSFDLPLIQHYFPDYEKTMQK